jgi:hypothetical protein
MQLGLWTPVSGAANNLQFRLIPSLAFMRTFKYLASHSLLVTMASRNGVKIGQTKVCLGLIQVNLTNWKRQKPSQIDQSEVNLIWQNGWL